MALVPTVARIWTALVYVALDPWVALAAFVPLTVGLSLAAGLAVTVVGGALVLALTLAVSRWLGVVERARAAALLGVDVTGPGPLRAGPHRFGWFGRVLTDRPAWTSLAYWVIKQVTAPVGFAVVFATWCGAAIGVTLPLWIRSLPADTARFGLFDVSSGGEQVLVVVGGLLLAAIAPAVTLATAELNAGLTRSLLGASRVAELEARLDVVSSRRDAAVVAAEAERRRIERDLHDGAQQRLVALGMSLGMAREKLATDPDAAKALVEEAHTEAKAAMTELRNIVRGIHPAVLSDRGLDAALSGLVARAPVPVALTVSLGDRDDAAARLPDAVEGAVYFVVAEALTNIARHASASRASVQLVRLGDRVLVEITDDGVGGASIRPGGGLAGLRDRVASLGGFLHVTSPPGGPTNLLVELPCQP